MGLFLGGLISGRIFTSEIWGAYFREDLFFFGGGGYQSKWLCTWKIAANYNAQSCFILKFEKAAKKQSQGASHPW